MYSQTTTSIFAPNTDKHEGILHKNSHGIQEAIGDALHEASDCIAACHAGGVHFKGAGPLGVAGAIGAEVLHNSSTEDILCKAGVALAKEAIAVKVALDAGAAAGILARNPVVGGAVGIGAYKLINQALEPVQQVAEKACHDAFALGKQQLTALWNNALFVAALTGDLNGVKQALDNGAEINTKNPGWYGNSAVQHAAEGGHPEVVEYLIRQGADVHQPNDQGNSAVDSARIHKNNPVIKKVHDYFELKQSYFFVQVFHGEVEALETLKYGALINAPNPGYHNHSAVQHAVESGNLQLVIELIKRGADVHQKNNHGNSAVDSARILQNANPKIKAIHDYFEANFKQPAKNPPPKGKLNVAQRKQLAAQNVARKAVRNAAKRARRDAKIIREFVQGYSYEYYFKNKDNPQALARLYYKVNHGFDTYPPGTGDALPNGSPAKGGMFADRDRAAKGLSTASSDARYAPCYGYSDLVAEIAREKAQEANNNEGLRIEVGGQGRAFYNGKQIDGREFREFQGCMSSSFSAEFSRGMR